MSLSASTVWEVRTTGSDLSGGGYVSGGTDYSQADSPILSLTDCAAVAASTTLTSATGGFTTAMIGNLIQISSGSGGFVAGFYQITARTDTNTVTLDRAPASGTNGTAGVGRVGGALASPGKAAGAVVAGNSVWIKSGTYSITSASTNVSGGCVSITVNGTSNTALSYWQGYATSRWTAATGSPTATDQANKPLLQASGISTATLFNVAGQTIIVKNLAFDGAGLTSIRGFQSNGISNNQYWHLKALNCTNTGLYISGANVDAYYLEATGCSTTGQGIYLEAARMYLATAHDNTGIPGISTNGSGGYPTLIACLSYNNSGAGGQGFSHASRANMHACTAYGNGSDGVRFTNAFGQAALNCIAYGNGGYGFNSSGSSTNIIALINCATGSNTSGATNNLGGPQPGLVTLTADPFVAKASGNFALNTTAGGGAACRAAGIPGAFPGGLTTGYLDIGAAQSQAVAGNWIGLG